MCAQKLKKEVEAAHAHVQELVAQGPKIIEMVPVPTKTELNNQREVDLWGTKRRVDAGLDSLSTLSRQGVKVRDILGEMGPLQGQKPLVVFKAIEEAVQYYTDLSKRGIQGESIPEFEFVRMVGRDIVNAEDVHFSSRRARINNALITRLGGRERETLSMREAIDATIGWVAAELDPTTAEQFNTKKPLIVVIHRSEVWGDDRRWLDDCVGWYPSGTNLIVFNRDRAERSSAADNLSVLVHEQFHYAAELGRRESGIPWRQTIWKDPSGKLRRFSYDQEVWLDEGITELMAQQLVRGRGYDPSYVSYAAETTAAHLIQDLVGGDVLKKAYLSGDYTEVARIMDEKLGDGAFKRMLNGRGSGGRLQALVGLLEAAQFYNGIPVVKYWAGDPIITSAGML